jgi:Universal stress protein family
MGPDVHSTPPQAAVPRRRILLCYDGSIEAKHALERVAEVAAVVPSRVTVISVADPIYPNPPYTGYADPGEEQTHRRCVTRTRPARDTGVELAMSSPARRVPTRR